MLSGMFRSMGGARSVEAIEGESENRRFECGSTGTTFQPRACPDCVL